MRVLQEVMEDLLSTAGGPSLNTLLAGDLVTAMRVVHGLPGIQNVSCSRVKLVYFCSFLYFCLQEPSGKCARESDKLREEGNSEFQAGRLRRALVRFTSALVAAPTDLEGTGREVALALANR